MPFSRGDGRTAAALAAKAGAGEHRRDSVLGGLDMGGI